MSRVRINEVTDANLFAGEKTAIACSLIGLDDLDLEICIPSNLDKITVREEDDVATPAGIDAALRSANTELMGLIVAPEGIAFESVTNHDNSFDRGT